MPALSKKLLRTLPTLTEVVDVPAQPAAVSGDFEEALIERVLQRLELTLDAQVQKVVADALQEQMKDLAPRIRQRVDNAVRKAVTQAVAAETKPPAGRRAA
jgi:cell division protein FtsI/penicillin-binding protein 2